METVFLSLTKSDFQDLIAETVNSCLRHNQQTKSTPQPETDQLFTIQQVAEFLSLSVPTIYTLVSKAAIPCMKKGKRLYFSKAEINNWIRSGKKNTIAEFESEADHFLTKTKRG